MRILLVENHAVFAQNVAFRCLAEHAVEVVPTVSAALAAVGTREYDAALEGMSLDPDSVAELKEAGADGRPHRAVKPR